MTKQETKLQIAVGIRNCIINNHPEKINVEKISKIMEEKGITRTNIKATIRSGNASFLLKDDDKDGTKTKAMIENICAWIDCNFEKPVNKKCYLSRRY